MCLCVGKKTSVHAEPYSLLASYIPLPPHLAGLRLCRRRRPSWPLMSSLERPQKWDVAEEERRGHVSINQTCSPRWLRLGGTYVCFQHISISNRSTGPGDGVSPLAAYCSSSCVVLQMAPPYAALLCTGLALVFVTSKAGLLQRGVSCACFGCIFKKSSYLGCLWGCGE